MGEGGEYLAGFILGYFVLGVFFALFAFAVGAAGFGDLWVFSLFPVHVAFFLSFLGRRSGGCRVERVFG